MLTCFIPPLLLAAIPPHPSSGGERNRVHLAKMLRSGCNVLMLDEPTNDLDVDTLRALEDALPDFVGSAIVRISFGYFLGFLVWTVLSFFVCSIGHLICFCRPLRAFLSRHSTSRSFFYKFASSTHVSALLRASQVISHDRWFLDRICTHILAFEGDGRTVFVEGNFR
jgi:ABC-type uncharacterized transport system ATPase subunit